MPARIVTFARGYCYHVYNRGSEKRTIFQSHRDYTKFLARTKDNAKKYAIDVLAFCLMPNHFHFLLRQTFDAPLVLFMNALQLGHAKYFNTKYTRVGPLFQGRFKARLVESDEYLLQLSAYIHRNPVAGLIDSGNRGDSRNLIRRRLRNSPIPLIQNISVLKQTTFQNRIQYWPIFQNQTPSSPMRHSSSNLSRTWKPSRQFSPQPSDIF